MSIQAIRKTGFLIEDGSKLGEVTGYLRALGYAGSASSSWAREMVTYLDSLRAQIYYVPTQPKLIDVQEIEEVSL